MSKKKRITRNTHGRKKPANRKGRGILLKFFGFFALAMAIFYAFYYSPLYENYIQSGLLNFQAKLSNILLNILGQPTSVEGDVIYSDDFRVSIKGGCDGVEATALYICAVLVFPLITLRKKLPGLLWGVGILFVINIFRISGLYLSGRYWPEAFDFLHLHGGVVIFTIISIILWMIWVSRVTRKNEANAEK
ncbi:MAG: archaeosortase/exosortase family protein [Saprospiraceae bacterium]|nr:archaeosortase/exosortase family protein [Saprospiraceae bacterium]